MDPHQDISPEELHSRLTAGEKVVLLDVREPVEWAIGHLEHAVHIPMRSVPSRMGELDPDAETVVYCHHGARSAAVAAALRQAGFRDVRNLTGGIDRWSTTVDAGIPRY